MKVVCSLLPGADTPILFSEFSEDEEEDDSVEYADEDATENQEFFNESVIHKDTNGDVSCSLPQPTNKNFMQPLTVECDPVGICFCRMFYWVLILLPVSRYSNLLNLILEIIWNSKKNLENVSISWLMWLRNQNLILMKSVNFLRHLRFTTILFKTLR